MRLFLAFGLALSVTACGSGPRSGDGTLDCVPYARQVSGVQLYGDAAAWWDQADGRYAKGPAPVPGGVLVFRRSGRLPYGHVAVVRRQVSPREITVDQANWVHRRVTIGEPVVDVSGANDWSQVRVWWQPTGALGVTTYQTYGFIAP